jgi:hypothetical protein
MGRNDLIGSSLIFSIARQATLALDSHLVPYVGYITASKTINMQRFSLKQLRC